MDLRKLHSWRDLPLVEVVRRLNLTDEKIMRGAEYASTTGLDALHNPDVCEALFFFRHGGPFVIYLSDHKLIGKTARALLAELGEPETVLRSRAGDHSAQCIYPAQGFAVSVTDDKVDFVELFPSTTLQQYRDTLYREPAPMIA